MSVMVDVLGDNATRAAPAKGWQPPGSTMWLNERTGQTEPFVVMWQEGEEADRMDEKMPVGEGEEPDAAEGCLTAAAASAMFWILMAILAHTFFF